MVEEKLIWKEIWKNQEALITFLRGQDARQGSSEYPPTLNLIVPLIIAASIVKKQKKQAKFSIFQGLHLHKRNFRDLDYK